TAMVMRSPSAMRQSMPAPLNDSRSMNSPAAWARPMSRPGAAMVAAPAAALFRTLRRVKCGPPRRPGEFGSWDMVTPPVGCLRSKSSKDLFLDRLKKCTMSSMSSATRSDKRRGRSPRGVLAAKRPHPVLGASRVPRYLQLAEIFRQRIARGAWKPGDMLPSIDMLMQEFSVARVTVRQAMRLLTDEGLVSPQRGRGTVVNEHPKSQRHLRLHTTLAGLVDMYRADTPVLTNLEESDACPELDEQDGTAAPGYFHMRRVHAR